MLKCAAEYLAIRNEVISIKEAEAKEKEKGKLAAAIMNSIDFCENEISKMIEDEAKKGRKEICFEMKMSRPTPAEESPLKESYFYAIKFVNYLDGRRTALKPCLVEETPYHYPTIEKYLSDHCIDIKMTYYNFDIYVNHEGPDVKYARFTITVPNNLPCS